MSHKNNKNSKANKKSGQKSNKEMAEMKLNTSNGLGVSNQSKKLGHESQIVTMESSQQPARKNAKSPLR